MSPAEFRRHGKQLVDFIADYWERVEAMPVRSPLKPGDVLAMLPESPPQSADSGGSWNRLTEDLDRIILPGLTHWQHPSFFGYFPANVSGPAVLGELLAAGLGVQGMLWQTSPACTELETRMLDWMREALGLPEAFASTSPDGGGVIQGTASEATLVAMISARAACLSPRRDRGVDGRSQPPARAEGSNDHLVAYASAQAHSSVIKAAMITGLAESPEDRTHLRLIETDSEGAMRVEALGEAMKEDLAAGRVPFFVCATLGTTGTLAFDDVGGIGRVVSDGFTSRLGEPGHPGPWLHVDAAHAGAACVCPEHRAMLRGVEHADSFAFNPHKWLLTNFDCNCFWTRRRTDLTNALSVTPEYLRNAASQSGEVIDYRDWQIPLGRRFRALKLWLVMRWYGLEGLRAHIREHVRITTVFEALVRADARFEIPTMPRLDLVCFRLRAADAGSQDAINLELMNRLNESGRLFLTHTSLPLPAAGAGRTVLRMAIGGTRTEERHVRAAWEAISQAAAGVIG